MNVPSAALAATLTITAAAVALPATAVQAAPSSSVPAAKAELIAGAMPADPAGVRSINPSTVSAYGYTQREFTVSGTAQAYKFLETPRTDGKWKVAAEAGSEAPYKTRVVVFAPSDKKKFSGNVISEWNNVTMGNDVMPDLISQHNASFKSGDIYVGVSAQFVGVEAAKRSDAGRYGSLSHPGDSWSYDIYSQVGQALRAGGALTDGLRPKALIADGESQSAGRLASYIDALAPLHRVYDGYLVHSRGGTMFPLQQPTATAQVVTTSGPVTVPDGNVGRTAQNSPTYTQSRDDLAQPVIYSMTETDVFAPPAGALDYGPATQANSAKFRLWEIAGSAHVDDYVTRFGQVDTGDATTATNAFKAMLNPPKTSLGGAPCDVAVNTGHGSYVQSAALQQLIRWVRTGTPASSPALFEGQKPGPDRAAQPVLDADGNIKGGVRSPAVDVPVAAVTGAAGVAMSACSLSGTTVPFTAEKLAAKYGSQESFEAKWTLSTLKLQREGFLTAADACNLITAAKNTDVL